MRNSEIGRVCLYDIVQIEDMRFISAHGSKTENSVRFVPLHNFVYTELAACAEEQKRAPDGAAFRFEIAKTSAIYGKANAGLGQRLGVSAKELATQNITFYSRRHFWKTLMNAHEPGDVKEYFMGNKVSGDTASRYSRRGRQGRERVVSKASEAVGILDTALF
jgi:integrase